MLNISDMFQSMAATNEGSFRTTSLQEGHVSAAWQRASLASALRPALSSSRARAAGKPAAIMRSKVPIEANRRAAPAPRCQFRAATQARSSNRITAGEIWKISGNSASSSKTSCHNSKVAYPSAARNPMADRRAPGSAVKRQPSNRSRGAVAPHEEKDHPSRTGLQTEIGRGLIMGGSACGLLERSWESTALPTVQQRRNP